MHNIRILLISLIILVNWTFSQTNPSLYNTWNAFYLTPPGAFRFGLNGYDNPALLNYLHSPDVLFSTSHEIGKWSDFNHWGIFAGLPHFGIGMIHQKDTGRSVSDYYIAGGFGDRTLSIGFLYGWSTGDVGHFNRTNTVRIGTLYRPMKYLSFGIIGTSSIRKGYQEAIVDMAFRPFGNELITFFSDYGISREQKLKEGTWSAGAIIEPVDGIRFAGRYFDTKSFSIGMELSFGRVGLNSKSHHDKNGKRMFNTYGIRIGAYDRTLINKHIRTKKDYVEMNLFGPVQYQRFKLFDKSNTLLNLLTSIDAAKTDNTVAGVAINLSGIQSNTEMLWELREKLKDLKNAGKRVVIYIDRGGINEYHLASIADKIVMDPTGMLSIEGYIMGRTFLKGALAKLGIGYDEWRFFKYKSAVEVLSRDKMSDADREQRQKLVNDRYKLVKSDICASRNINPEKFDSLVNEVVLFTPQDALQFGLVDTLGRWDAVKEIVKTLEGDEKGFKSAKSLDKFQRPLDNYWGEPPYIAVIYALGECAMDEGITARKLVKDIEKAKNDDRVKAIVFRVDSPGGDGLASDLVAEELKKCKEKKPVIVSQGSVAGSGGYWLSMYGDTIVSAPNTITGSIGVIGGWLYNKSLKETLGLSTDFVKVGNSADLGFGFSLPLINIGIPDRNLTPQEYAKMERLIKLFYREFVEKVAKGRKKSFDDIEPISQGRVWSGYDAKEIGLVDILGGLETAINIAKEKAGIAKDEEIAIIEYPEKGWINLDILTPKLFGIKTMKQNDPLLDHLLFRLKYNGQPMPIMPLDFQEIIQ